MGERRGPKALELWCRRITDGYSGVNVQNMTTSWKDGLAFCAMIHHFRPDLIDFDSLDKNDVYGNNELAFRIAEQHLGIPALLDAEDMASCTVPDRLSILTYLSQFYQTFGGSSPNRTASNRTTDTTDNNIAPVTQPPQSKMSSRLGVRRDLCAACSQPVFIAEKLVISRSCYHRTCFRCARCGTQLTHGGYYETETGEYCCETCPDEEEPIVDNVEEDVDEGSSSQLVAQTSFRDKENIDKYVYRHLNVAKVPDLIAEAAKTRLDYMSSLLTNTDNHDAVSSTVPDDDEKTGSLDAAKSRTKSHEISLINDKVDLKDNSNVTDNAEDTKEANHVDLSLNERNESELRTEHACCDSDSQALSNDIEELSISKSTRVKKPDEYPESLNPFASDEDEELDSKNNTSTNPFDMDEEDEVPSKRRLKAPHISLNPFDTDEDDAEMQINENSSKESSSYLSVMKSGINKNMIDVKSQHKNDLNRGEFRASNTSIASSGSASTFSGTHRKKKQAPPPPNIKTEQVPTEPFVAVVFDKTDDVFSTSRGSVASVTHSARKNKPAPPPPISSSTPKKPSLTEPVLQEPSTPNINRHVSNLWEDQKINKDETNRNKQSLVFLNDESQMYKGYIDKSAQGKWKRKKGPAPPRPIPHKRKIKVISMKDVKLELDEIEMQQQGLEKQGVRIEQLIRDKCENGTQANDTSLSLDVEELVLELFALVNEKNELFRRQAELMLLRRQQRLEEEHVEVEYQIRCLMSQSETTKTDYDKQKEELLIQRLIEIVERRNEIVECLEMDRRREIEEDRSINSQMDLYAARNKAEISNNESNDLSKNKKVKIKGKIKDKTLKKIFKKDADKDVDETETKEKRSFKKRWF